MRRKAFVLRTIGISLFCVLFSQVSFAQTDKADEFSDEDKENSDAKRALSAAQSPLVFIQNPNNDFRFFAFVANSAKPVRTEFFGRRLSLSDSATGRQSLMRLRRGGVQTYISSASGITQISETQTPERRGLVSSNGQRPTSNFFT